MRCEGGIVGLGDLVVDLIGKCGSPALRERWTESRDAMAVDVARGVAASERLTTEVEQWTYDFGRNRFLQLVTLWNGRIVRFEQGGYGHGLPPALELPRPRVTRCDVSLIRQGDTKVDALGRCGPPTSAVSWEAPRTRPVVVESGSETWGVPGGTAHVELWVYNLGPNQFIRIVRFEDGRVTSVETGGYGYPD
jgi:hypothetical protein